jgi:phage-related protein
VAETVKIPIELQLEKINQNQTELNKFVSNIQGQLSKVQKEAEKTGSFFNGLGGNLIKAFSAVGLIDIASRAVSGLASALAAPIEAASEAEESITGLNIALALSGQYTEDAADSFLAFAAEIQRTTKFGDDAILQSASLIQSLARLDQDGLKRATSAAVDLASALKIDLQTASMLVGKAAEGNIGAFGRYGIAIQKGKTDTETFANTLKTLESRFGGAAAAGANSFSGALTQLNNVFGDLLEEIGFAIVKNKAIIASIQTLKNVLLDLTPIIAKLSKEFISLFVDIFQFSLKAGAGFVEFARIVIQSAQDTIVALNTVLTLGGKLGKGLSETFNKESIDAVNKSFDKASFTLLELDSTITAIRKNKVDDDLNKKFKSISDSAKITGKNIDDSIRKSLESLDKTLETAGLTNLQKFRKEADDRLKIVKDSVNEGIITRRDAAARIAKIELEFSMKTAEEQKKINKEVTDEKEKATRALKERAEAFLNFDLEKIVQEIAFNAELNAVDVSNLTAGFTKLLKKGAEGASEILAKGAGLFAETLMPGVGKAVSEIFAFLAQGATKIREQIFSFFEAVPDIIFSVSEAISALPNILIEAAFKMIEKLLDGLPEFVTNLLNNILYGIELLLSRVPDLVLAIIERVPQIITAMVERVGIFIQALADKIPVIIQSFVEKVPTIIQALVDAAPEIITTLVEKAPDISMALSKALIYDVPKALAQGIYNSLEGIWITFRNAITDSVKKIFDPIIAFFKNLPVVGGQGLVPDSIPLLGKLNTGGTVPSGFPNDTFTAGLTSGELVIPKDDVSNLRSFLANQKENRPTNNSNDSEILKEILRAIVTQRQPSNDSPIVINVGGKTIVETLKSELKSGRVIFA